MKIVHLCLSNFYIDNYSYQENMLPKFHVLQGHEVTVIASMVSFNSVGKPCYLKDESTTITKEGFKVIRIDYNRPLYKFNRFIRVYKSTFKTLADEKPDLIFIHDFSFMDIGKVIKYVRLNKNVKVFVDCHTDYINSAQTWVSKNIFHHLIWRYYGKLLSPYVEKFFGVTPLRCDFLKNAYRINPSKVELLEMGVDDDLLKMKKKSLIKEKYNTLLGISDCDFVIVTGGKIDDKKNIHLVMKAVNELNPPNVKLIVFGTIAPEMQNYFDSLLTPKLVIYVGWLDASTILDYFIYADLIVFPGTHSVLWEQAVGVGTPCIFKYWKGITHIDLGGNCILLYEDTVEELKLIFSRVLDDENCYKSMKDIANKEGLGKFAYSNIAKRAITS